MRVAILLLGFGLVACADPEAIRVAQGAQDDAKCQSYGAKPGTQPYFDCRLTLETNRNQVRTASELNGGNRGLIRTLIKGPE